MPLFLSIPSLVPLSVLKWAAREMMMGREGEEEPHILRIWTLLFGRGWTVWCGSIVGARYDSFSFTHAVYIQKREPPDHFLPSCPSFLGLLCAQVHEPIMGGQRSVMSTGEKEEWAAAQSAWKK